MVKSLVLADKKKALPSIQQLRIVNMTGRLKHDYPRDGNENMVFTRDDILANTTTRIPLRMLYFRSGKTFRSGVIYALYPDPKDRTPVFGELSALEQKVERETWIIDQHKSRFPDSFGNSSVAKHKRFGGVPLNISSEVTDFTHHNPNLDTPVSASEHFDLELVQRQWKIALRLKTTVQEGLCGLFSEV